MLNSGRLAGCSKRLLTRQQATQALEDAYPPGYVEDAYETRTMLGKMRVSARLGRVGEIERFFSILR